MNGIGCFSSKQGLTNIGPQAELLKLSKTLESRDLTPQATQKVCLHPSLQAPTQHPAADGGSVENCLAQPPSCLEGSLLTDLVNELAAPQGSVISPWFNSQQTLARAQDVSHQSGHSRSSPGCGIHPSCSQDGGMDTRPLFFLPRAPQPLVGGRGTPAVGAVPPPPLTVMSTMCLSGWQASSRRLVHVRAGRRFMAWRSVLS